MIVISMIILIYVILISSFIYGFQKVAVFKGKPIEKIQNFTVVIPFRNEANNLPELLKSLENLDYPTKSFECLFVNDDSDDDSLVIVEEWIHTSKIQAKILQNKRKSRSPKKDAIQTAIEVSRFEWIITTDADCILPNHWLKEFSEFSMKNDCKMMAGPVQILNTENSFLHKFQHLDFLSLQGSSFGGYGIGKPIMCNGANLAYRKDIFQELKGFEGNNHIASGDDIFLFEKFFRAYPNEVRFLKSRNSVVITKALNSWKEVFQQRIRWASKSGNYQMIFPKIVGLIVFLGNVSLIISLILILINPTIWYLSASIWLAKGVIDAILLNRTSRFFNLRSVVLIDLIKATLFYPFFTVYVAVSSFTSSYRWKDRTFKK